MAILRVFADESGTPPVRDDDEVFLGAAYALVNDPLPDLPIRKSGPIPVARYLATMDAAPHCWYVRPGLGFEEKLRAKHAAMETMARYRILQTGGRNALTNIRNWVWAETMAVAGGSAAAVAIAMRAIAAAAQDALLEPPARIHICFHWKRARGPVFEMKRLAIARIAAVVRNSTAKSARFLKRDAARRVLLHFASTFSLDPNAVTVEWFHDHPRGLASGNQNPYAGPLWLAHSLAKNFYCELRKQNPTPGFMETLKSYGYPYGTAVDFTPKLLAGLSRNSVAHWSRSTRLPIPAGTPIEEDDATTKGVA